MRVNEIFYSLQGEGRFTGTPAIFIRLSGCNRACHFCDTDFAAFTEMSDDEILDEISRYPARHVVITGGEPALQLTEAFVDSLHNRGYFVQIETNGSLPVPANLDWVTCSPKDKPWNIGHVDELKVVYTGQDVEATADFFTNRTDAPAELRLQPCSGANIPQTVNYILSHPRWSLSLQTHKLLDIR